MKKYNYRSAVTGKLVSKSFAEANPDTTVREVKAKAIAGSKQSIKKTKK